ncbi:MAG TPA: hypothetical protein VGJ94_10380 [Syntrophorhabdaceae bacterium]|jgi:Tfp pilus assembly protein PilF
MRKTVCFILLLCVLLVGLVACSSREVANDKMRIAIGWREQGDMFRYRTLVNEAYQADPNNPFALNDMGTIAESRGNYQEAEGFYQKAIQNAGNRRVSKSDVKRDEGRMLKDVAAENLRNVQAKMK